MSEYAILCLSPSLIRSVSKPLVEAIFPYYSLDFYFQYSLFSCLFYVNPKILLKFPPNYDVQQLFCLLGLISNKAFALL